MMCTISKCCCCGVRWGAFVIAVLDMIMAATVVMETKYLAYYQGWFESNDKPSTYYCWMVTLVIHFAHLVACVVVIVSVWVQINKLVMAYLIIGIVRIVYDLVFFVYVCVEAGAVIITLLLILSGIGLAIYFWVVAYSWFKILSGSSPVN
ncbi:uncharacterized protein LOC108111969 isoform X2 [Drosophila eugracilis]|uniref:uncharacterized protein LOC108111969 isoform X2 n=1 Tax=Drosophila eugracilis TaxID=29029 RepID=UPI0007E70BA8|nr:uncharacterized protein LOC108111969 isoform X2 [Drosophila eugracilis]